jgi:SUMO ligase MMS21 Smc5/6 complex component
MFQDSIYAHGATTTTLTLFDYKSNKYQGINESLADFCRLLVNDCYYDSNLNKRIKHFNLGSEFMLAFPR